MAKQSALAKRQAELAERLNISVDDVWSTISRLIENLATNEQSTLIAYYGNTGHSIGAVARGLGLNSARAGQLKDRAVRKIEAFLRAEKQISAPPQEQEIEDFFNVHRMGACGVVYRSPLIFVQRLKTRCEELGDPPVVHSVIKRSGKEWLRCELFGNLQLQFLEAILATEGLALKEEEDKNVFNFQKLSPGVKVAVDQLLEPVLETVKQFPDEAWAARIMERFHAAGTPGAGYVNFALHKLAALGKVEGPISGKIQKDGHLYKVNFYRPAV